MGENIIKIIENYKSDIENILGTTEQEIFSNFYNKINRKPIEEWTKNSFIKTTIKCEKTSIDFRSQGNDLFKQGHYDSALKKYTDSLNFAPKNSENYSLALANRSAVFFAQNDYESCLTDINNCLDNNYPENLKYKIYLRQINCYLKINNVSKAMECFEKLKKIDLPPSKKDEIEQLELLIIEQKNMEGPQKLNDKNKLPELEKNLVSLQFNKSKGRHVIASQDIKTGQILFIEKPFSFVPIFLPDNSNLETFCYHCFSPTSCPIPCENCTIQFCSQKCFENSWLDYHRFECTGSCSELWSQVGVNFLATRILILGASTGYKNVFSAAQNDIENFGKPCSNYDSVCYLVSNVGKMDRWDVFPHVVTSVLITNYLKEKTDFFDFVVENQRKLGVGTPENLFDFIGSVLLKHILQVITNATSIETVENDFYKLFNSTNQVKDTGFQFCGVGMYPSVSMMNHSCDVNITNYFINDCIVVKAKVDIKKGEEIFNSYGYDCRKQVTVGRKEELKKQHFFDCTCTACTIPSKPEKYHEGLLCQKCNGISLAVENDNYECFICKHTFSAKNHFLYIRKAEELYEKYERTKEVDHLKKCLELREKAFYKYNFSIYTTHLDLQNHYGINGDINNWWHHTLISLEKDKEIVGENNLKIALNLRLCLLILLRYIASLNMEETNNIRKVTLIEMMGYANEMFENMKKIFVLYYDENKINFSDIDNLLQLCIDNVTHILGEKLYITTIEDDMNELYFDDCTDV